MASTSYEASLTEEMEEIKAAAATRRTFGDNWKIAEDIEEALRWIRNQIDKGRDELRTRRARIARYERRGWDDMADGERRWLARDETLIARECAHRDELSAGLREIKRQERDWMRTMERVYAELRAERGEG